MYLPTPILNKGSLRDSIPQACLARRPSCEDRKRRGAGIARLSSACGTPRKKSSDGKNHRRVRVWAKRYGVCLARYYCRIRMIKKQMKKQRPKQEGRCHTLKARRSCLEIRITCGKECGKRGKKFGTMSVTEPTTPLKQAQPGGTFLWTNWINPTKMHWK